MTADNKCQKALKLAKINASENNVSEKLLFIQSNLFEEVSGSYDIIVSNPPYIETREIEALQVEVKDHEPRNALEGGQDGLDFYRRIVRGAPGFLKPQGLLAFEIGYTQAKEVKQMMEKDFHELTIIKDLSGNDRVVLGWLINPSTGGSHQHAVDSSRR